MSLISQWSSYPAFSDRVLSLIGIEIHWAILQYVLGLSFMAFLSYLIYLKTGNSKWERLSKTMVKGFVLVFAVGAATGTASEFGLILLWPNLTEAAGRYIYFPLYAEIFAFLMEVVFVYMLFYGWSKFPKKIVAVVMLLVFIGAWYSAAMIVSVNSFMVAPTGLKPAFNVESGGWLYDMSYPKITLAIPTSIAEALNITALQALGTEIIDYHGDSVIAAVPVRITQRLAYEAWNGYLVKDSILASIANKTYVEAHPDILNDSIKSLLDSIMVKTVEYMGVATITFKSPVYPASILHTIGSALTVSGFTATAAYALRLRKANKINKQYREYVSAAFKFTAVFTLIAIGFQGFVSGHEMGVSIAHYNPEKFAAIEATTDEITALTRILPGGEKLPALLAYGDPNAPLPSYDGIPRDYCALLVEDMERIGDCRPPLLIHYLYYTKIGLGLALGLYALIIVYFAVIRARMKGEIPGILLKIAPLSVALVQLVSFLGWAVREIGRKPWTIYGIMTTDVAHTSNPPSQPVIILVATFFIGLLAILSYSAWRILWLPGNKQGINS